MIQGRNYSMLMNHLRVTASKSKADTAMSSALQAVLWTNRSPHLCPKPGYFGRSRLQSLSLELTTAVWNVYLVNMDFNILC